MGLLMLPLSAPRTMLRAYAILVGTFDEAWQRSRGRILIQRYDSMSEVAAKAHLSTMMLLVSDAWASLVGTLETVSEVPGHWLITSILAMLNSLVM